MHQTDSPDDNDHEIVEAIVPLEAAGKRFDAALAEMFPEFSRSRLTEWIKSGDALLEREIVKPKVSVRGGETVSLCIRVEIETRGEAEQMDLDIVYQDADVLVINKPAGLVVHPGAGNSHGTLVNGLLYFDPKMAELPRAGIVHRLDKDTSGLMVIARSLRAHSSLVEQLSAREVHRQYLAVVAGTMVAGGTVDAPIDRHPKDRIRMGIAREGAGRDAVTHYRLREKFRNHTLLECRLETGRTHQIRVHLTHIKHAIVGDPVYGLLRLPKGATPALVETLRTFRRQALHAEKLSFVHPITEVEITTEAPMPEDMQNLLKVLRDDSKQAL